MKFTIFKRLAFSYMVIMLFVIFLAGYMTYKLNKLNRLTHSIASVDSATIGNIERLLDAIFSQVSFEKKYLISKDPDFFRKFWEIQDYVIQDMKALENIVDTSEKKDLSAETKTLYNTYLSLFKEETDKIAKGLKYSQEAYLDNREKVVAEINLKLRDIIKIARSDRDRMIEASSQTSYNVLKVVIITA